MPLHQLEFNILGVRLTTPMKLGLRQQVPRLQRQHRKLSRPRRRTHGGSRIARPGLGRVLPAFKRPGKRALSSRRLAVPITN